jgi:hypothetical protein
MICKHQEAAPAHEFPGIWWCPTCLNFVAWPGSNVFRRVRVWWRFSDTVRSWRGTWREAWPVALLIWPLYWLLFYVCNVTRAF